MRDVPRVERVDVRTRDVLAEGEEAAEEDADVARLDIVQPLLSISHSMNAPTASGSDFSIATADRFRTPYGSGTGSTTTDGRSAG